MTLDLGQLNAMAASGLLPMFDSESRLFCYRMKRSENGLMQGRDLCPVYDHFAVGTT